MTTAHSRIPRMDFKPLRNQFRCSRDWCSLRLASANLPAEMGEPWQVDHLIFINTAFFLAIDATGEAIWRLTDRAQERFEYLISEKRSGKRVSPDDAIQNDQLLRRGKMRLPYYECQRCGVVTQEKNCPKCGSNTRRFGWIPYPREPTELPVTVLCPLCHQRNLVEPRTSDRGPR